ncbi:MAG: hypothetical protein JNM89_08285 [Hyphomicrobiaceae bacterium]|nr:hypothetical protein [Hyphomicrobiaceae bacterium]
MLEVGRLFRSPVVLAAVLTALTFSPPASADDRQFTARSGTINIPAENRSFVHELSAVAKKYPELARRSRLLENMCEVNPACFYVESWTACCCVDGGATTCEAFPIE